MIRTKDLVEDINYAYTIYKSEVMGNEAHCEIEEYREEIIKRLLEYGRITTCPRKSNAVDTDKLVDFCGEELKSLTDMGYLDIQGEHNYKEVIRQLRAFDRICHDLKELVTRLSSGVNE